MDTLKPDFLHNHPGLEVKLVEIIGNDHVVVDKRDWEIVKELLNSLINKEKYIGNSIIPIESNNSGDKPNYFFDKKDPYSDNSLEATRILRDYVSKKFITTEDKPWEFTIIGELGKVTWSFHENIEPLLRKLYPSGYIDKYSYQNSHMIFTHRTRLF